MILRAGSLNYEPVHWDTAFEIISDELRGLSDPNEAIFFTLRADRVMKQRSYMVCLQGL